MLMLGGHMECIRNTREAFSINTAWSYYSKEIWFSIHEVDLRIFISNKFPNNGNAAGLQISLTRILAENSCFPITLWTFLHHLVFSPVLFWFTCHLSLVFGNVIMIWLMCGFNIPVQDLLDLVTQVFFHLSIFEFVSPLCTQIQLSRTPLTRIV